MNTLSRHPVLQKAGIIPPQDPPQENPGPTQRNEEEPQAAPQNNGKKTPPKKKHTLLMGWDMTTVHKVDSEGVDSTLKKLGR